MVKAKPNSADDAGCAKTAALIYSRDSVGTFRFAFARKVSENMRIRAPSMSSGAAGTDPKFWGRWVSFGGTKNNKNDSDLSQAMEELKDEGDIPDAAISSLKMKLAVQLGPSANCTHFYLFEISNYSKFERLFPPWPETRGGSSIVQKSKGEIDVVANFSMEQLSLFSRDRFASYVVKSFNAHVLPYLRQISRTFRRSRWGDKVLEVSGTDGKRTPRHYNRKYYEYCTKKCPFQYTKYVELPSTQSSTQVPSE